MKHMIGFSTCSSYTRNLKQNSNWSHWRNTQIRGIDTTNHPKIFQNTRKLRMQDNTHYTRVKEMRERINLLTQLALFINLFG